MKLAASLSSQQVLRHSGFFFLLSFAHFFLHFFRVFGGFLRHFFFLILHFFSSTKPSHGGGRGGGGLGDGGGGGGLGDGGGGGGLGGGGLGDGGGGRQNTGFGLTMMWLSAIWTEGSRGSGSSTERHGTGMISAPAAQPAKTQKITDTLESRIGVFACGC